jgi:D-alanine-D-alanine ligase
MMDLRDAKDERSRNALAAIVEASVRLAGLLRLCDCFSMDFRTDAEGRPTFFEFEVCPAVTIYDFQSYLGRRGLTLGAALAKSMQLAFAKRGVMDEA